MRRKQDLFFDRSAFYPVIPQRYARSPQASAGDDRYGEQGRKAGDSGDGLARRPGAGRKSESGRPVLKETGSDHSEDLLNMEAKAAAAERVRESGA